MFFCHDEGKDNDRKEIEKGFYVVQQVDSKSKQNRPSGRGKEGWFLGELQFTFSTDSQVTMTRKNTNFQQIQLHVLKKSDQEDRCLPKHVPVTIRTTIVQLTFE